MAEQKKGPTADTTGRRAQLLEKTTNFTTEKVWSTTLPGHSVTRKVRNFRIYFRGICAYFLIESTENWYGMSVRLPYPTFRTFSVVKHGFFYSGTRLVYLRYIQCISAYAR